MECIGCGCIFCPDSRAEQDKAQPDRIIYCTDECRKRTKRRRKRAHRPDLSGCRTPEKDRYYLPRAAELAIAMINKKSHFGLRSWYTCGNHIHLTRRRPQPERWGEGTLRSGKGPAVEGVTRAAAGD